MIDKATGNTAVVVNRSSDVRLRFKFAPRLFIWMFLIGIPLVSYVWTWGRLWPGSDEWFLIYIREGGPYIADNTRPFAYLYFDISYILTGGRMTSMYVLMYVLQGAGAGLLFEICRLMYQRWLGQMALYVGLLTALVYVMYPGEMTRHSLIMINARYTTLMALFACLIWILASKYDRPIWTIGAFLLVGVNLLASETTVMLLFLFPLVVFYFKGFRLQRHWWIAIVTWYIGVTWYLLWRVVLVNNTADAARPISPISLVELPGYVLRNLLQLTLQPIAEAYNVDWKELVSAQFAWSRPEMLVIFLLFAAATVFVWLQLPKEKTTISERHDTLFWLFSLGIGLMAVLGAITPYAARGWPLTFIIEGPSSRDTFMAAIGVSMLFGIVMLRRRDYLMATVICLIVLGAGFVRQTRSAEEYAALTRLQEQYWPSVLELPINWTNEDIVVFFHDFPFSEANQFWGLHAMLNLFTTHTFEDFNTFNTQETRNWSMEDGKISLTFVSNVHLLDDPTPELDVNDVRIIRLDAESHTVSLLTEVPENLLTDPDQTIPLRTGYNLVADQLQTTDLAQTLLASHELEVCRTTVPVYSPDTSPEDGTVIVELYPEGKVIDRRFVEQGEQLNFELHAPCGNWLRVYFTPDEGEAVRLVSQYGLESEYGTSDETTSVSYHTHFQNRVPCVDSVCS